MAKFEPINERCLATGSPAPGLSTAYSLVFGGEAGRLASVTILPPTQTSGANLFPASVPLHSPSFGRSSALGYFLKEYFDSCTFVMISGLTMFKTCEEVHLKGIFGQCL